ncbi:hypothetical protein CALCODRAFT_500842 [Calocera cornea HHB12733]|uniref:Uncharacterized protein n=1 Tax=Calocera cornea HHB12733 TaxID=1353952 RepID=A0A165DWM5_9BASI|nr:hypothetical protein CALCODRAFT_500842 [Calocera cornea HHB12733]
MAQLCWPQGQAGGRYMQCRGDGESSEQMKRRRDGGPKDRCMKVPERNWHSLDADHGGIGP